MDRNAPILLVEDDKLDVKNVKRAFKTHGVTNPLFTVLNGEEALAFLRHEPPYDQPGASPSPGVILLDLNMPVMGGLEFLHVYKQDDAIKHIPAVVLTTSAEERDRVESYRIGIAGYIVKPVEFAEFLNAIGRFDLYWTLCAIPK